MRAADRGNPVANRLRNPCGNPVATWFAAVVAIQFGLAEVGAQP